MQLRRKVTKKSKKEKKEARMEAKVEQKKVSNSGNSTKLAGDTPLTIPVCQQHIIYFISSTFLDFFHFQILANLNRVKIYFTN